MKKNNKMTLWHKIMVYIFINIIFLTIFAFIDMYLSFVIDPLYGSIITLILWTIAAYYHIASKKRTRVDGIVDEL